MRGAAMSLKAAVSGLVIFLLSVSVVKGEDTWRVTHSSAQICAVKGSTVEIPCTYTYPSTIRQQTTVVQSRFWFTKDRYEPVDVRTDPDYSGRVEYLFHENVCTLRIKNLRERDSAVYKFMFTTNQSGGSLTGDEGVTLSITDLQVQVETKRNHAELKCYSSCNVADNPSYVWYRNGKKMTAETSSIRVSVHENNKYSCSVKGREDSRSPEVYAPKLPSVSVSPSAEIVEGSSVTLTCSSDANPAATFKWYKRNQTPQYLHEGAQLVFNYIQPSASGEYYCGSENKLGRKRSGYVSINVKYAPSVCSASVSPAGEIRENSRVTVTCSCDANPAPEYTWFNVNGRELSKESELVFSSVQSSDSGRYYCKAKNDLGERTSGYVKVEVKYAPKLPSVSVSPSAEIVEGSSVTLTCSSDANPAANYTWYKEDEDSPTASGQIFNINNTSPEHSGHYICIAQNTRGRHNSTVHLTVLEAGGWKLTTAVTVPAIFLIIILIFVVIWIIKKRACKQPSEPGDRPENSEQIQPAEEQDELQYATVDFSRNQADPLYSNIQPVKPQRHKKKKKEEEEGEQEEMVEYSVVNFNSGGAAQSTSGQQAADPAALYSTVNKHGRRNL